MHCPSCGQQQMSNETKFCSRCGMPLGVVSEVLMHGGYLPQLAELSKKKRSLLTRRNGLGFSLIWFLFFLFIMAPFWGILDVDPLAGVSAVIGIFGGLIWLVASLMFLKKEPKFPVQMQQSFGQHELHGQQGYSALPPQQTVPASSFSMPTAGSWRDTNDLQPGSVTEGTTRLLEKEEREP
jgi:hypothetical protein